ncbi:MAG: addiction module toxin, RelE/StbE family [Caulobacteraceae bacterium]|nr:addiction module toxin, RelE/StbE family [Caulobacteraceae bacterium]
MGWRIALTERARRDLHRAVAFIGDLNPPAAEKLGLQLLSQIYSLDQFPKRGAPVPNWPSFRQLVCGHHLIIYRINDAEHRITIAGVWDARQDPSKLDLTGQ